MKHDTPVFTREEAKDLLRRLGTTCFDRTLDAVLFLAFFLPLSSGAGRSTRELYRVGREVDALLDTCNGETVRTWWKRLRAQGWIGRDLRVTSEGQQRLAGLMPAIRWNAQWDHHWHLVSFDVAERKRNTRDQLRSVLRRLGFGMLHASLWISPHDFFGDIRAELALPKSSRSIVFGTTERLGTTESKDLAATIWPLENLNAQYKSCLTATHGGLKSAVGFLATLRNDPQLPRDLLPAPWYGFAALRMFKRNIGTSYNQLVVQKSQRP